MSLCGTCVSEACGWVEFDPFSSCMMGQVEGGAEGNVLGEVRGGDRGGMSCEG